MYSAIFHDPVSDGGERKPLTLTPRHGYAEVSQTAGLREPRISHRCSCPCIRNKRTEL